MDILYTCTSYPPAIGGAQLHLHHLAVQLAKRHRPRVISLWDEIRTDWLLGTTLQLHSDAKDYQLDGITVHRLGLSPGEKLSILPFVLMYYPLQGIAIEAIARVLVRKIGALAKGVDLVHNLRIGREPLSFASYKLSRDLDVPFFLTPLHHPRWKGWLYRHYARLYRLADGVIALTEAEKDILVAMGVAERRITVTGTGPILAQSSDGPSFREKHRLSGPVVLFLGQKFRHKNIGPLLKASRFVWERYPETRFVFIGPRTNYSRGLMRGVDDTRILDLDTLTLQEKTNALAACDVLCLPSSQESFGGVLLEAWMMDKPVVGGDIPAVRKVIAHGVDGLITEPTPQSIAESIVFLLDHPRIAEEMARRGKQKVIARYTWDRIAERTEGAYLGAIKS